MDEKTLAVAVIDDDPADVILLERHLRAIPGTIVEMIHYSNWADCRTDLPCRSIDIIFLDYILGPETGLDILKKIRMGGDTRPVIILTGQGDEQIAAAITRAGANDYLVKSDLSPQVLRRSIQHVLDNYRLHQEKAILAEHLHYSRQMESIGAMAGGIAHDFNNLLTAILGYLELAKLKNRSGDVWNELTKIRTSCEQMADSVQQILNFSDRWASEQDSIILGVVLSESVAVLRHTLPANINLDYQKPDLTLAVRAASSLLHQIIQNIVVNGAESMPNGGVVAIRTRAVKVDMNFAMANPGLVEGDYALLEISDSGTGIDPEIRHRVFEPFYTTKDKDLTKGSGLGLSLVWRAVHNLGGWITFNSRPEGGTVFQVYLPLAGTGIEKSNAASAGRIPN